MTEVQARYGDPDDAGPVADYHDRAKWLAVRRTGLGSSDIAAIFGLHPFKSAHDVWLDKVDMAPPVEDNPDMRRGRRLEPIAAQLFTEVTGLKVRRQPLKRAKAYPWLLASVDRQILSDGDTPTGPLEIKVPRSQTFYRWRRKGLPDYVVLQGQLEAGVWDAGLSTFGIYNPDGDELLTPVVPADAVVWEQLVNRSGEWWENHVIRGIEPEKALPKLEGLPEVTGEFPVIDYSTDETFRARAAAFFEARELVEEAKAVLASAKAEILEVTGDSWGIFETEEARFYHRPKEGRRSFQPKLLEAAEPLSLSGVMTALEELGLLQSPVSFDGPVEERIRAIGAMDLSPFWKQGQPYAEFRAYQLRGGPE
jgi:putative phage-type endonuclease